MLPGTGSCPLSTVASSCLLTCHTLCVTQWQERPTLLTHMGRTWTKLLPLQIGCHFEDPVPNSSLQEARRCCQKNHPTEVVMAADLKG